MGSSWKGEATNQDVATYHFRDDVLRLFYLMGLVLIVVANPSRGTEFELECRKHLHMRLPRLADSVGDFVAILQSIVGHVLSSGHRVLLVGKEVERFKDRDVFLSLYSVPVGTVNERHFGCAGLNKFE